MGVFPSGNELNELNELNVATYPATKPTLNFKPLNAYSQQRLRNGTLRQHKVIRTIYRNIRNHAKSPAGDFAGKEEFDDLKIWRFENGRTPGRPRNKRIKYCNAPRYEANLKL